MRHIIERYFDMPNEKNKKRTLKTFENRKSEVLSRFSYINNYISF